MEFSLWVSDGFDAIRAQRFPRCSNEGILIVYVSVKKTNGGIFSLERKLSGLRKYIFLGSQVRKAKALNFFSRRGTVDSDR